MNFFVTFIICSAAVVQICLKHCKAYLYKILMLQVLELDFCNLLTSVSLELPHLRNLSLVHCRKYALICESGYVELCSPANWLILSFVCRFLDLNLRCFMLSCLNVFDCPALQRISITSHALQVCISLSCKHVSFYFGNLNAL